MALRHEVQRLAVKMRTQGWRVELTRASHWKWIAPNGAFFFSAQTPSDHRAVRHIETDIAKVLSGKRRGGHDD